MHLKSLYPDLPPLEEQMNVYEHIINRPEQNDWQDYTVQVEMATGKTRTFNEVRNRINILANALGASEGLGLKGGTGELIGIMSDNSMDYATLVLACLKIAVPFSLISCYSTPFELKHAMSLSNVTRLFVANQYLPRAGLVATELGLSKERIHPMGDCVQGYTTIEDLIKMANIKKIPKVDTCIVPKDTLAYLLFSSGTTGLPKAVMISHGNVLFAIRQAVARQEYRLQVKTPPPPPTPDGIPVVLAFLPMYHTYGLHSYCLRAFLARTRFIIMRKWDIEAVINALAKYKITQLHFTPSMIHQMVSHPKFKQIDFSTVASVHSGAAYLPRELTSRLLSHVSKDAHFDEGYGMSECTISAIIQPFPGSLNGRFTHVPTATGVLIPGMEARIVREDGSEAAYKEAGELWVRGPNIALGYWNNPKATTEAFGDGWLRTGDKFWVDENQYFYFADRAKDTLKISGAQVSPVEIENVLFAHPRKLISDVTVAGVSGGRTEDEKVPRAWVVLSEVGKKLGDAKAIKELEAWHRENLSRYKWLRGGIEVVEEIPKSPTGKSLRRVLQERYGQRVAAKAEPKL